MASQYKNLFFDLDDTLWAFSLNARDTFEEMYHKYDYGRFFRSFLHFYTLYQHRNTELWEEYGRGQVSKEELNRQRFLYPLEAVGARDVALAEAFSDDFFSVIPTKNRLMPHAYGQSKKRIVLEVCFACSSLCVTITIVRPSSLFSRWRSSMTSAPILESRLPVGSSARIISG